MARIKNSEDFVKKSILMFAKTVRNEEEYDKDVLKELLVFDDTSKQPSRIKCATLSANGIKDYLEEENHS